MRFILIVLLSMLSARFSLALTPVTGRSAVCTGASITLSNATPGGSWESGSAATAVIDATTGVLTGVSSGTVLITYTVPGAGSVFAAVVIYPRGVPISGSSNVCKGSKTTMTAADGGWWSINNGKVAVIDEHTGVLTGISNGTATVSYSFGASCITSHVITVDSCNRQGSKF